MKDLKKQIQTLINEYKKREDLYKREQDSNIEKRDYFNAGRLQTKIVDYEGIRLDLEWLISDKNI